MASQQLSGVLFSATCARVMPEGPSAAATEGAGSWEGASTGAGAGSGVGAGAGAGTPINSGAVSEARALVEKSRPACKH
jgi:hypothetical protein